MSSSTWNKDSSAIEPIYYRLPIEDLVDGNRLRKQVVSMQSVFNFNYVLAQASPMPALVPIVMAANLIYNSFKRVRVCREICADISRQLNNVIFIVLGNQVRSMPEKVAAILKAFEEAAKSMEKEISRFAMMGFLKSWLYRHHISGRLGQFQKALDEFCKDYPTAVTTNVILEMHESLRLVGPSIQRDGLERELYNKRMDPTIDISTLPADLSIEVRCTNERPIKGSQYYIKQGKWLNRDVVALKYPRRFEALTCSSHCGGTEESCPQMRRHGPAADAMRRFLRQVEIWRKLDHPNVLKLYGWCKLENKVHLVTPWLEAGNVSHYCGASKLSGADILKLIRGIAVGLQYLHSKNVVHAALSPNNVLIKPDGGPVIGDFSRAKIVPPDTAYQNRTETNDECTFMRYQAPEEQKAPRPMSRKGDIFAWSMVSLEIISGVQPYPEAREACLLYERIYEDKKLPTPEEHPSPLWERCSGLWELIHSCQNGEDPPQRPSLEDIIAKLDKCIEEEESQS